MGINTEIRSFQLSLIKTINASKLPIEVKRLVVANVLTEISKTSEEILIKELEEQNNVRPSELCTENNNKS